MSATGFIPTAHNGTPLKRVLFIVEFLNQFSQEELRKLDELTDVREELPKRTVLQSFAVSPQPNRMAMQQGKQSGVSFERIATNGEVQIGLRAEIDRLMLLVTDYTRWSEISPRIKEYLEPAISQIASTNSVVGITSEYVDQFESVDPSYDKLPATNLLNPNCSFLSPHIFTHNDNWHLHTGFYTSYNSPSNHRVLNTINIDLVDDNSKHVRQINFVFTHKLTGVRIDWANYAPVPQHFCSNIIDSFEYLHDIDKDLFIDVLKHETAEKIPGLIKVAN